MKNMSCDVIRDLLPLYVDGVLSDESKSIVEEHLRGCADCSEHYQDLKYPAEEFLQKERADEKAALKKIRKKINTKKIRTAILAAACAATVIIGAYYGVAVHETYIPYEESGIYVTEDAIRSDIPFYGSRGIYSPDGETLFLFMTSTVLSKRETGDTLRTPLVGLSKEDRTIKTFDDDQNLVEERVCKEVYYLPKEQAKPLMRTMGWTNKGEDDKELAQNREREVEEYKAVSTLIWREE